MATDTSLRSDESSGEKLNTISVPRVWALLEAVDIEVCEQSVKKNIEIYCTPIKEKSSL